MTTTQDARASSDPRTRPPGRPSRLPTKRLTPEQSSLVEGAVGHAKAMACKFAARWPGARDDFVAAAYMAMVQVAPYYDPSRGVPFTAFAAKRIRYALWAAVRELFRGGWKGDMESAPSFVPFTPNLDEDGVVVGMKEEASIGLLMDVADDFRYRLSNLSPRLAAVFRLLYCDGRNQQDVAALMGTSKATICRLNRRLQERLGGRPLSGAFSDPLAGRVASLAEAA